MPAKGNFSLHALQLTLTTPPEIVVTGQPNQTIRPALYQNQPDGPCGVEKALDCTSLSLPLTVPPSLPTPDLSPSLPPSLPLPLPLPLSLAPSLSLSPPPVTLIDRADSGPAQKPSCAQSAT